jgi:hypothetical protein
MRTFLSISVVTILLTLGAACSQDVNNKDAVRAAVLEHLNSRKQQTGLNLDGMNVEIGSVSFEKDQATANVFFKPKAGGEGMQIPYVLDLKGGKWVVRRSVEGGAGGHGAGAAPAPGAGMTIPPAPPSGGKLPEGHPSVPSGAKQ